ncbi:MAG: response regulator [Pseudomonadota bacterium]
MALATFVNVQEFAMDRLRVLVADDNKTNLFVMKRILDKTACDYVAATDGLEAVAAARAHRPNLVLLDISMPNMDGIAAAKIIREDFKNERIVIVAVTANDSIEQREACHAAGFDRFMAKPIKRQEIVDLVESLSDT